MVDLSILASDIESKLNGNQFGLQFKIFPDTGEFKKAVREGNTVTEIINGELRTISSDVTSLTEGLQVITQNCKLDLIVKLEDIEDDEVVKSFSFEYKDGEPTGNVIEENKTIYGNAYKLENVRNCLNSVFQSSTVENVNIDEENSYTVTAVYSLLNSGQRNQVQILGNSYTFTVYIYYFFIQNGINTQEYTFKLDGKTFPLQSFTIDRIPTMDGYVPLNTKRGATENISSMSSFGVSIIVPAFKNQSESVFDWLFDGELNVAHILSIKDKNYLVSYGQLSVSGETVKNMGQTISFVECPKEYDLVSIPSAFFIYRGDKWNVATESVSTNGGIVYNFNSQEFFVDTAIFVNNDVLISTKELDSAYLKRMDA